MTLTIRFAALLAVFSSLSFAGSWSGALVDSKCYDSRERNVSSKDTLTFVDRDTREEVRYCSPTAKTKAFAVVQQEGPTLKLDPEGNAKAAQFVRQTGKKSLFLVSVMGQLNGDRLALDSISLK